MSRFSIALLALLASVSTASAQGITNLQIVGNDVTASLDLLGVSADLTLSFEQSAGLTAASLGLSAQLVNPNDLLLVSRLPAGGLVTVPGAFPVLVRVRPPATGGLSFTGLYTLGLHTSNLDFIANCPLRLFSAPDGGSFQDITVAMGSGSYRVRGSDGSFSEFLIVADLRPPGGVINQKFNAVNALLAGASGIIPAPLLDSLKSQIQNARSLYNSGDSAGAASAVDAFTATVQAHSGGDIPDVWRASRDVTDVAGLLRAAAGTLSFSLSLAPVH